jgi:hypothetical protein
LQFKMSQQILNGTDFFRKFDYLSVNDELHFVTPLSSFLKTGLPETAAAFLFAVRIQSTLSSTALRHQQ